MDKLFSYNNYYVKSHSQETNTGWRENFGSELLVWKIYSLYIHGMRVYYEHADQVNIPDGPQYEIGRELLLFFEQKMKYRLMWELRSIEDELNKDGGVIIFTKEAKIHFKDIDEDLVEKAKEILSHVNWDIW